MKAILWDYAGVLAVETDCDARDLGDLCGLSRPVWESVLGRLVDTERWWDRVERGELPLDSFASELRDRVRAAGGDCDLDVGRYLWWGGRPRREPRALNAPVVQLAVSLSADYTTGIATNNVRELRASWSAGLPQALLAHVFDSSELGTRKPEPAFWERVEAALELAPADLVLVDDNADHAAAAAARGWRAIHYVFPAQCADGLADLAGRRPAAGAER
jgi:FMN phosphatase YigB (HAD superfamily)